MVDYKSLPREPGVYLFKNAKGTVIYVGKAKVLKNRVSSYFQKNLDIGTKTQALISRIKDLEYIVTASELEALILEAELIKKFRPKYNIVLKDDKSYLYIVVRDDAMYAPRVLTARESDLQKGDVAYGPYPSTNDARSVVRTIRKVFPYRDCSVSKYKRYSKLSKPCLYGHLGLCQAPCVSGHLKNYRQEIGQIKKFLGGGGSKLINSYQKKMTKASKDQHYEEAARYRDVLKKLAYVRQSYKTASQYIDNPNLVEDLAEASLNELVKNIPILNATPMRIECYDISNLSGTDAVGSMVVATNGLIDKSQYRNFKIKQKDSPDDFAMMAEVLTRRLKRDWPVPDLLVMDGGKGQVSAIAEVLEKLELEIPLIGLAKRYETIVYKDGNDFEEVKLPKSNDGLKLLIRLRDESHRFAQRYHHKLRQKSLKK